MIVAIVILGILVSPVLTGAAFVAGFFTNFMISGTLAISAGRRAVQHIFEPRLGILAGTIMGVWVGLGALAGMVIFGLLLSRIYGADVRLGLMFIFGLVILGICIFAARIAGRENAHPPEVEEV
jgi:hypothetical protein